MEKTEQETSRLIHVFRQTKEVESLRQASALAMSIDPEVTANAGQQTALRRVKQNTILEILAAIDEEIDPAFDPQDVPLSTVSPPVVGGVVLDTGIAPRNIKDPMVRKAYEEAIANNHEKARRYGLQISLRRLDDDLMTVFERFTTGQEPYQRELGEAVEKHIKNPTRKTRLQALLKTPRD